MASKITTHRELEVYNRAFTAAMELFELSKTFPREETYALTDQLRRSSRSVCANLAEAWRKRRYLKSFLSKLNDCESEATETQVWIEFSVKCAYIDRDYGNKLYAQYDRILATIVGMINHPDSWIISKPAIREEAEPYNIYSENDVF